VSDLGGRRGTVLVALVLAATSAACGEDAAQVAPDERAPAEDATADGAEDCDWPTWGHDNARTFAYPAGCPTALAPGTVGDLGRAWFFNTRDVVTASPAVVDGRVYVGDWSGRFYALDAATGEELWTFDAEPYPNVYAGLIVSSAAVAAVEGEEAPSVLFGAGRTLYALDAASGEVRWTHELTDLDPATDFTEIESSPAVADGLVLFGYDVHNRRGQRAGVRALDLTTGEQVWDFDPEEGREPLGCGDVWSSPAVDEAARLVLVGSANCPPSPDGWGTYTEALFALDLDTGEAAWSYQPHPPNNDDLDFAGAPNLFEADGRRLAGLGNKDARYYVVDRDTGEPVWDATATEPGITAPGGNFSTGGFIGPTAVADGVVVGGTAVGACPCLHAMDAATGQVLWQQDVPEPTYAAALIAGGVVFVGGTDFTLRAYDLHDGAVLWSHDMAGVVAGGAVVVGDDLFAVAGIRDPGVADRSTTSGVYRFSLGAGDGATSGGSSSSSSSSTDAAPQATDVVLTNRGQRCIDEVCPLGFDLVAPPEGTDPTATLEITSDPFTVTIRTTGLGDPAAWLRPGGPAEAEGATQFALFASERDDNPVGGLLCVLSDDGSCTGTALPRLATYNRISLLAVAEPSTLPPIAEGIDRLMLTIAFDPPLTPEGL
jgi:polyvinyl alcohol dehydrogenase (cytochrome)